MDSCWLYISTPNRESFIGKTKITMFIVYPLLPGLSVGSHETICRLGTSTSIVVICVVLSALIFCSRIFANVFFAYRANGN